MEVITTVAVVSAAAILSWSLGILVIVKAIKYLEGNKDCKCKDK